MSMKRIWGMLAAGTMLSLTPFGLAGAARADVKMGVDAWQQGDYAKAVATWQPLAQAGDPDAQFNMGQAYKLGRGVKADPAAAIDWYRKAAKQGHSRAEDNLGLLMFQQGDRAGAFPYLQHAAERGEPRAQYIVGTALFNGDLTAKNWVRAYALMTRASESGLAQATASLRQMDKYIPQDQRNDGIAMARSIGRQEKPGLAVDEPRQTAPVSRDAPKPIRSAQLPPSTPPKPKPVEAVPAPRPAPAKAAAAKPPAPKPALPKAANGGWRVQIGAFSAEARARTLWSQLSAKVSGLSGYQPYILTSGGVTRLQAGPLASSADASKLCGAIKAAGADCMPKKM
ncbi:SPOR domain-containing protein [Sphingobium sp. JS3065]|uniref:SPOR domain-containing protein n=1 Tax=Sphingobium sp. JS3065 TaxID=2970925 RepID=UPI0022650C47|nr:SPOR domain-containing protein [Sphingobium sp. JS3065]UZW53604.1 SPOR domain-containing protein [Sphingobium sp. JS3065]